MIDKVEFPAKNLTSNAGVLLLLNYTEEQKIFQGPELPHQKSKRKSIDASYKNLNKIILIIT